jgi:hypothetical protein
MVSCAACGFGVQNGRLRSAPPPTGGVECSRPSPSLDFDGFCGRGSGTTNCTESQTRTSSQRDVPPSCHVSLRRRPLHNGDGGCFQSRAACWPAAAGVVDGFACGSRLEQCLVHLGQPTAKRGAFYALTKGPRQLGGRKPWGIWLSILSFCVFRIPDF